MNDTDAYEVRGTIVLADGTARPARMFRSGRVDYARRGWKSTSFGATATPAQSATFKIDPQQAEWLRDQAGDERALEAAGRCIVDEVHAAALIQNAERDADDQISGAAEQANAIREDAERSPAAALPPVTWAWAAATDPGHTLMGTWNGEGKTRNEVDAERRRPTLDVETSNGLMAKGY